MIKITEKLQSCGCSQEASSEIKISNEQEAVRKDIRSRYKNIADTKSRELIKEEQEIHKESDNKSPIYSKEELNSIPKDSHLGLGSGNPVALANVQSGETVVDLGSGAGIDCFLAAKEIGDEGKVIGVDMTPEMIEKARNNAKLGDFRNVEFRLGEIENLPVADESVDVVISNCVINLSTDKSRVFKEAFRVLKHKGRIMISDIVLLKKLPEFIKESVEAYVGCLSGAMIKNEYLKLIKNAGFEDVEIIHEDNFPVEHLNNLSLIKN